MCNVKSGSQRGCAMEENDKMTVIVVDDDEGVRDSLKFLLESCGLEVEEYSSTEAFARGYQPQLRQCLILDQHLPSSTGLDFLASPQGERINLPVILVTGRGDSAIRARAEQLGVVAYLEKPIDDAVLLATIERAVYGS
jgi:two-component system, LuxR family, response regulator FixJ